MITKHVVIIETYKDSAGIEYDNITDAIQAERLIKLNSVDIDWKNVTPKIIVDNWSQISDALTSNLIDSICT